MLPNIFDHVGHIKTPDPAEVVALPDNQRDALMACLAACDAAEAGEQRVTAAHTLVAEKMREYDAALAADNKANPAILHHDALRLVSAANGSNVKTSKAAKPNKETRAALTAVTSELADARAEYNSANASLKILSAKRGDKIILWIASGERVTDESIAREYQATSQAHRAKVASGEIAPKPEPVRLSEIDRVLTGRGKAHNRLPKYLGKR